MHHTAHMPPAWSARTWWAGLAGAWRCLLHVVSGASLQPYQVTPAEPWHLVCELTLSLDIHDKKKGSVSPFSLQHLIKITFSFISIFFDVFLVCHFIKYLRSLGSLMNMASLTLHLCADRISLLGFLQQTLVFQEGTKLQSGGAQCCVLLLISRNKGSFSTSCIPLSAVLTRGAVLPWTA